MSRRSSTLVAAAIASLLLVPAPAALASITEGDDVCSGSATIKGVTYTPDNDTPGNAIPLPDESGIRIPWTGTADMDNSSHSGSLYVDIAGFSVRVASWEGGGTESTASNVYDLDDFYAELDRIVPVGRVPGVWKVSGEHNAEKRCAGFAMIRIEGNPLANIVGWIVLIGLLITIAGIVYATRGHYFAENRRWRGRPTLGGVSGFFLGIFLALALMMFGVRPLDRLSVFGLPLILAVLAVALALWAPIGRGKTLGS